MLELQTDLSQIMLGVILAVIIAIISLRLKALTISGMAGAVIIGSIVFGLGGWLFALPLLFFFITSNILSKLKTDTKLNSLYAIVKAGPRDIYQVLANGGVAMICTFIQLATDRQELYFLYLASIAVATSDTWATEVGTLLSGGPISIITFKRVNPGQSGGISLPGTIAALFGSFATAFIVYPLIPEFHSLGFWLGASFAGFIGSMIDSILGATVQAGYRCQVCDTNIEVNLHCDKEAVLIKGFKNINNDMVNFLSNLIAISLLAWLIL